VDVHLHEPSGDITRRVVSSRPEDTISMVTGKRFCGAVRNEVAGSPRVVCICHCSSCRKATGGAMIPWAMFRAEDVRITRGVLREDASSPDVTNGDTASSVALAFHVVTS